MDFGSDFIFVGGDDGDDQEEQPEEDEVEKEYDHVASYGGSSFDHVYGFECEIMESEENCDETPVTFAQEQHKQPKNRINTNTINLKMSSLKEEPEAILFTEPIRCENIKCDALFSDIDSCKEGEPWLCKFCGTENKPNQWPSIKVQDVLYAKEGQIPVFDNVDTEQTIIFVIDVSGSMGRTLQISQMSPTLQEIVATEHAEYIREMSQVIGMNIVIDPNVRITEVSWLQAVKASIIDQLVQIRELRLRENKRQPKVGLITFGDYVTLYKDGWGEPIKVEGGQLADDLELLRIGADNYQLGSLLETCRGIETCIKGLKCEGQTALGPALTLAQGMVSASKGSKIIICTDGIANVGVGNLEAASMSDVDHFYQTVIKRGKDSGTSITVLSFDNCKLDKLGPITEETGGIVDLIKPTELGSRLKDDLSRTTIATNAFIKFVVHKSMYIQVLDESQKESTWYYPIGNIQMDKKVPFCFAPHGISQAVSNELGLSDNVYPFQVQIHFTDMRGNTAWRVWTKCKPVTNNRKQAQSSMNQNIVVQSFMQRAAALLLNLKEKPTELKVEAKKIVDEINQISREKSCEVHLHRKLMEFSTVASDIIHSQARTVTEDIINKLFKIQQLRGVGS